MWQNTYISKCYNKDGIILGGELAAGVGGICGISRGEISEVFNMGQVGSEERLSYEVGGIVGVIARGGIVKNSYNHGEVYGDKMVAGICGRFAVESSLIPTIKMCYNKGNVSAINGSLAGIVVCRSGLARDIQNCYYQENENFTGSSEDNDTKITDSNGVVEGKSESELTNKSTFVNWDFENIWKIDEGVSMPSLINVPLENASL